MQALETTTGGVWTPRESASRRALAASETSAFPNFSISPLMVESTSPTRGEDKSTPFEASRAACRAM